MHFVSEALILSGAFLLTTSFVWVGFLLLSFGIFGGISNFLYNVSLSQNSETRKTMVYADVKSIFEFFVKTAQTVGIDEQQKNDKRGPTIH